MGPKGEVGRLSDGSWGDGCGGGWKQYTCFAHTLNSSAAPEVVPVQGVASFPRVLRAVPQADEHVDQWMLTRVHCSSGKRSCNCHNIT